MAEAGCFAVMLVGKDGTDKRRSDRLMEPEEVYALTDAMPARSRERGERGWSYSRVQPFRGSCVYPVSVGLLAAGPPARGIPEGRFLLDNIGQWVMDIIAALGYLGLALLLVAENLFPPIPSEVVLPFAGFLVGQGDLNFWGALVAATLGSVLGALILYVLGRWGGRRLILRYGSWLRVDKQGLDRAEGWFRRWGDWVVLFARIVPLARSIVSIPAGTAKMPLARFVALTTIGSALWNALLIGAGALLGANWALIQNWIGAYSNAVLIVATVAVAVFLFLYQYRRER